jgi:hypothetical protein
MRRRSKTTINDLRVAIDCLPRDTRIAMLRGISANPIIVGAYTDGRGICPMLAAHRSGGRTSFISFARAWDNFAFRSARVRRARRASHRELLILRTHLEASLLADEAPDEDLAAAIAEHRVLADRQAPAPSRAPAERRATGDRHATPRPGDPDRSGELRRRGGWRWMRIVRSLDDYERALEALEALERDHDRQRGPERRGTPDSHRVVRA